MSSGVDPNSEVLDSNLKNTYTKAGPRMADPAVQRVMGGLAAPLAPQMGITATSSPVKFLDLACGGGVLTQQVRQILSPDALEQSTFVCGDNGETFIKKLSEKAAAEGWRNTTVKVMDAKDTGLSTNSFTHVGIALALHVIPDPDVVVRDCIRILQPGAIFGASTIHRDNAKIFWFAEVRAAFSSFSFDAPFPEVPMQTHSYGHWDDPEWLQAHAKSELSLLDVEVKVLDGSFHVNDGEGFVEAFGLMLPWICDTYWSEETRKAHPVEEVEKLLVEYLNEKYQGGGWDVPWKLIYLTGRVDK